MNIKNIFFAFSVLQILISFSPATANSEPNCNYIYLKEIIGGKQRDVYELQNLGPPNAESRIPMEMVFGKGNEKLVFGFDIGSHGYLAIGGKDELDIRHDGNIIIFRLILNEGDHGIGSVREGPGLGLQDNLIVFRDVHPEAIARVKNRMRSLLGKRLKTYSCLHSACSILSEEAGITLDDTTSILPSDLLNKILVSGFRGPDGLPIEYDIYRINGRNLNKMVQALKTVEKRVYRDAKNKVNFIIENKKDLYRKNKNKIKAGGAGFLVVGPTSAGLIYIHKKHHKKSK